MPVSKGRFKPGADPLDSAADLESVQLPGIQETAQEAACSPGKGSLGQVSSDGLPTRNSQGLVKGAVAHAPSLAPSGSSFGSGLLTDPQLPLSWSQAATARQHTQAPGAQQSQADSSGAQPPRLHSGRTPWTTAP